MLIIGSCATKNHEPCQIRKEAAVSGHLRVPQGSLVGVNCLVTAYGFLSEAGAQLNYLQAMLIMACSYFWLTMKLHLCYNKYTNEAKQNLTTTKEGR